MQPLGPISNYRSFHSWKRIEALAALIYFGAAHLLLSEKLIYSFFEISLPSWIILLAMAGLGLSTFLYLRKVQIPRAMRGKLSVFGAVVVFLTLVGLTENNLPINIYYDVATYLVTGCLLALGAVREFWVQLENPLVILYWAGFLSIIAGMGRVDTRVEGLEVWAQFGVPTTHYVSYRAAAVLNHAPLLFATAFSRTRWDVWKVLGLGSLVSYLGIQVYFLKRAPSARAVAYALAVVVTHTASKRRTGIPSLAAVLGLAALGYFVLPRAYVNDLADRYQLQDRSRFDEASAMLEDLSSGEWLVGRGMGGTFRPPSGWKAGLVETADGQLARPFVHIGILQPLLKGGLIFMLSYYSFFSPLLRRKRPGAHRDQVARSVLPVYLLFQFIEGAPSLGNLFDATLVALAGRLHLEPATASTVGES